MEEDEHLRLKLLTSACHQISKAIHFKEKLEAILVDDMVVAHMLLCQSFNKPAV